MTITASRKEKRRGVKTAEISSMERVRERHIHCTNLSAMHGNSLREEEERGWEFGLSRDV